MSFAATTGNWKSFQFLLAQGAALNKKTIMPHAGMGAGMSGDSKILRFVAAKGADLNAKDYMGRTALWHSAFHGEMPNSLPDAEWLLSMGANPNVGGADGFDNVYPMIIAIEGDHLEMAQLLVSKAAKVDPKWPVFEFMATPRMKKLLLTSPGEAQATINPEVAALSETAPESITPKTGEISLSGTSTALKNGVQLSLSANQFTLPNGKTGAIKPAKIKTIVISAQTFIHFKGQTEKLTTRNLSGTGLKVEVLGTDSGSGKPPVAREIIVATKP